MCGVILVIIVLIVVYWREELRKEDILCGMWTADDDFLDECGAGSLNVLFKKDQLMILMSDDDGSILVNETFDYTLSGFGNKKVLCLDRECPMMAKKFSLELDEGACCMTWVDDTKMYARLFKDGEATLMTRNSRKLQN
jgi:hypothetical protein